VSASHAADLELARRCAAGDEQAWEELVRTCRPVLYRAADALDPKGGARDLADALYADLYGVRESPDGERRSLLRYYHGRSSLATWLRAVLAQRYVDRIRAGRRLQPLPDDEELVPTSPDTTPPPERRRAVALLERALGVAVSRLESRDRLRLGCYYRQALTLVETGRLMREHEATVSRQLGRTRRALREDVERQLREAGLNPAQMAECFEAAADDPGTIDLAKMLDEPAPRKESAPDRSLS
jgi:RNA polymerase sigma factor (sigma-70 family)